MEKLSEDHTKQSEKTFPLVRERTSSFWILQGKHQRKTFINYKKHFLFLMILLYQKFFKTSNNFCPYFLL